MSEWDRLRSGILQILADKTLLSFESMLDELERRYRVRDPEKARRALDQMISDGLAKEITPGSDYYGFTADGREVASRNKVEYPSM